MKKIILTIAFIVLVSICPVAVSAKSNWSIVKTLCKPYKKPIKLVSGHNKKTDRIILHRKNKKYIIVEKTISISTGKDFGYEIDGHYHIAYNKRVKKNKKVISYIIYSPFSNECDEILYVVDNNTYR